MGQANLPAPRAGHARVGIARGAALVVVLACVAVTVGVTACQRKEAPVAPARPVIPPPPARPSEFVHPPIPSEPVVKPARAECSGEALVQVAARVRELQRRAARAALVTGKTARREGCGSAAMIEVAEDVKGPLVDRVRGCVAQDETFDPEWNLLDAAMITLATCADCNRPVKARAPDCNRVADLVGQAAAGAQKPSAGP
jgi:hypothetical protein